jgi:hypothetical protein
LYRSVRTSIKDLRDLRPDITCVHPVLGDRKVSTKPSKVPSDTLTKTFIKQEETGFSPQRSRRYSTAGFRRVRLATLNRGGRRITSREALARFTWPCRLTNSASCSGSVIAGRWRLASRPGRGRRRPGLGPLPRTSILDNRSRMRSLESAAKRRDLRRRNAMESALRPPALEDIAMTTKRQQPRRASAKAVEGESHYIAPTRSGPAGIDAGETAGRPVEAAEAAQGTITPAESLAKVAAELLALRTALDRQARPPVERLAYRLDESAAALGVSQESWSESGPLVACPSPISTSVGCRFIDPRLSCPGSRGGGDHEHDPVSTRRPLAGLRPKTLARKNFLLLSKE